jgi:hypothetical protein
MNGVHMIVIPETQPPGQLDALALRRKISVREAAALNDMSIDTFRRRYRHLIRQISPRRQAVELGDALAIGNEAAVP